MTINTQTNQAEINQEYNQARETAALYIQLLEELQLRHPNLLKDFSQNIKSLLQNEVTEGNRSAVHEVRLNNYGIPMTLLETQVEDMLKNGIYSVMPEYVYYKDRTRLEFLPNGTKRNRLKKDNAMEHLERYFSPYLRYFTPSLTEQGEEPLYMFQLRHIDSNLARALIDFSDMHPDLLKSTSTVVPSKQQSGDKLLRNLTLILTLNPLEARRVSTRNNLQHRRSN